VGVPGGLPRGGEMRNLIYTCIVVALSVPAVTLAAPNDLAVVVNKSNSTSNLTKSEVRKLVLGEQESWPGGVKVTVALLGPGSPARTAVLRVVCRMSEDEYVQHALHSDFTGESTNPPRIVASDAAILQMVASVPGAVGFVPFNEVNGSVKVVSVEGVAAGEPDYKIKVGP
jgi:ABC-type phosphate transport system substrate-binding protein